MKHIIFASLVISMLMVFTVGTAFAAPDTDRDPGDYKASPEDVLPRYFFGGEMVEGAFGGGIDGGSGGEVGSPISGEGSRGLDASEGVKNSWN